VPEIIEVSSDSKDEGFLEFELDMVAELVMDLVGSGEVNFVDPEADRPRKKPRVDGHDNDTSDAYGDYEIVYLIEDTEDEEDDLSAGEDPYLFIIESERDSDSE
jgi:hypothetical protein